MTVARRIDPRSPEGRRIAAELGVPVSAAAVRPVELTDELLDRLEARLTDRVEPLDDVAREVGLTIREAHAALMRLVGLGRAERWPIPTAHPTRRRGNPLGARRTPAAADPRPPLSNAPETSLPRNPPIDPEEIIAYASEHGPLKATAIADHFGRHETAVRKHLRRAVADGRLATSKLPRGDFGKAPLGYGPPDRPGLARDKRVRDGGLVVVDDDDRDAINRLEVDERPPAPEPRAAETPQSAAEPCIVVVVDGRTVARVAMPIAAETLQRLCTVWPDADMMPGATP